MYKYDDLTENESNHINILIGISGILILLMFIILIIYYNLKTYKHFKKIIYSLSYIYLALTLSTGILYFIYRKYKSDIKNNEDMAYKPLGIFLLGFLLVALFIYLTKKLIKERTVVSNFVPVTDRNVVTAAVAALNPTAAAPPAAAAAPTPSGVSNPLYANQNMGGLQRKPTYANANGNNKYRF